MILDAYYVAIKSLSRLLSSENSKHIGKEYYCENCLQVFHSEISIKNHMTYCLNNKSVKIEMPYKKPVLQFCDGQYQFKVPFMMYADFETLLEPVQGFSSNPESSWTIDTCNHIPSGWAVYSKFAHGEVENPLTQYRGPDCVKKFCDHIIEEAIRLHRSFPELPMDPLTPKELERNRKAKNCHICFKTFTIKNRKVRDHCHYSGKYRGAAHRNCNLQYKIPSYIPIVFHNLAGYDAHLFIRELGYNGKMNVIAKNKEDYISFSTRIDVGDKKG